MLYKVYMVDDELLALNVYKKEISWIENGFELIGTNTNPNLAIPEINKLKPHVVFTDIKMPLLTGNQMIEKLQESNPNLVFVIISSYDDFQIVRRSLQLSVFDYLLKPVSEEAFESIFDRLKNEFRKKNSDKSISEDTLKVIPPMFSDILKYINNHFNEKLKLFELSEEFNISQNTLCSYFNKFLDTTFVSYITKLRMNFAAKLLLQTGNTIGEIANMSGYEDYFYFCNVFRKNFGCPPSVYRSNSAKCTNH
jgi:two-component system response regulator YesN